MSDLIDRQAAIDAVIAEGRTVDSRYLESERVINESDAVEALSMLPSVQSEPEEQRRGKWINEKINSYTSRTYCSECGNSALFICVSGDHYGQNMHGEVKKTKFCPDCGAEMSREESDNE